MGENLPRFTVRHASSAALREIHAFHVQNLTGFLFPRTEADFTKLIEDDALFEAVDDNGGRVAMCYIKPSDSDANTLEFGGVFVATTCRGTGVADALGIVAITSQLINFTSGGVRLMAHVHELNSDPLKLMKRLGFERNGEETVPKEHVPNGVKLNKEGLLIGHVYDFQIKTCRTFADWLERFSGGLEGPVRAQAVIDVPFYRDSRSDALEALRGIADYVG